MANAVKKKKVQEQTPVAKRPVRRPIREKVEEEKRSHAREFLSLLLAVFGIFLALALLSSYRAQYIDPLRPNSMGMIGQSLSVLLIRVLGWCSFVAVIWAFLLARTIWNGGSPNKSGITASLFSVALGFGMMAASGASIAAIFFGSDGGGSFGLEVSSRLVPYLNVAGATLFCGFVFLVSLIVATGVSATELLQWLQKLGAKFGNAGNTLARAQFRITVYLAQQGFKGLAAFIGRALGKFRNSEPQSHRAGHEEEYEDFSDRTEILDAPPSQKLLPVITESRAASSARHAYTDDMEEDEEEFDDEDEDEEESESELLPIHEPNITVRPSALAELKKGISDRLSRKKGEDAAKQLKRTAEKVRKHDPNFELPPVDLLAMPQDNPDVVPQKDEILKNCRQLEKTLMDFRIGGRVVDAAPGPVITLYQFEPAPGVKVQRIVTLADDLALSLKVASVRVYAPVPGKGTVGIEVPNAQREIVRLRDILDCERFLEAESPLTLALGKDISGDPYVADLAKMPHLLIAGATGTGKSVCINSLLLSLLYRNTPAEMRLILIDPKMLELSSYESIPHLKAPVVTLAKRARGVLWWAVEEMERRYKMMMDLGVKNLDGYNKAVGSPEKSRFQQQRTREEEKVIELEEKDILAVADRHLGIEREDDSEEPSKKIIVTGPGFQPEIREPLPRIVIVIDELADLMLTVGREVEELVTRLAQKARASGIHLILATQRPSVDVITGLIKANFPARISFKVASRIDARTVLDTSGAEALLGQGDMLFMTAGAGRPKRIHAAFVSDSEVNDVCDWLREQGAPDFDPEIEEMIRRMDEMEQSANGGSGVQEEFDFDPLYDQAVNLVLEKGQASTSMVQRAFRIGYNRAARILETMEREGVVGPADGARPRSVLIGSRDIA